MFRVNNIINSLLITSNARKKRNYFDLLSSSLYRVSHSDFILYEHTFLMFVCVERLRITRNRRRLFRAAFCFARARASSSSKFWDPTDFRGSTLYMLLSPMGRQREGGGRWFATVRVHVSRSFFSDYPTGASLIRVSTFFAFLALFSQEGAGRILCLHRVSLQEEQESRLRERR